MSVEIAYVVKCDAPGCTRRLFREAVGPDDAFGQVLGAQWDWAMTGIRATRGLEMSPDEWAWPDFFFDAPVTAFQVARAAS
jgi:hypothetical protein